MFSTTNVEKAILSMNSPQNCSSAVEYINNWTQQPESILTSLELILSSDSENVKLTCSSFLSHSIINFWNQIDPGKRKIFRDNIINFILDFNQNYRIFKFISTTIAHIAVYDYPEAWPEFSLIIFPPENLSEQRYINSAKIFHKFVKDIRFSQCITENRRNSLKNLLLDNILVIINYLNRYLEMPLFVKDSLGIYSYILLWIPNDETLIPPILDKIIFQFMSNEELNKVSMKCLTSIFISRSDSSVAFRMYSPYLIKTLSNATFLNQKPITSSNHVIDFITRFFNLYIIIYEIVFVIDQAQNEVRFAKLIDSSVNDLYQTICTKEISLDDLKNDIIHLFQVILSVQIEDVNETFWLMWNSILRRYKFETLCNFPLKPVCIFYEPLYQIILQSLYNVVPSAMNEGVYLYQARGCFNSLFFINQDVFVQFLHQQTPSVNLCYAIGLLEFILDSSESIRSLSQVVCELLDTLNSSSLDPQYANALLFCLPRSSYFYHDNKDLFSRFIEFVITCMNDQDLEICDSAAKSLSYIVTNRIGLFGGESKQFIQNIIELSERFFYYMNNESAFRMFKVCTVLICHFVQADDSKELFNRLFEPVMTFLTSYLTQIKHIIGSNADATQFIMIENMNEKIEKAVTIICECTNAFYPSPIELFNLVWPSFFEFTILVISNISFPSEIVLACLTTLGWIQCNRDSNELDKNNVIQQVFKAMIKRGRIEAAIFIYITIIRESEEENPESIENLFPFIFQNFIMPLLNSNDDFPFIPVFGMLSTFNLASINIEWMITLCLKGIRDYRKDVNFSAIQCLRYILSCSNNEQYAFLINNYEIIIISTLIESITDEVHNESITKYVDFIRTLFITNSTEQIEKIMKIAIITSLKKFTNEPSEDFYENFVNYLTSICNFFTQFNEAFMNLLIILRKASPGDCNLFEVEPVHQNIIYDEMIRITEEEVSQ